MASSTSGPARNATTRPTGASSSTGCSGNGFAGKTGARPATERDGDRGFVLIPVIWIAAALVLAFAAFSLSVRSHLRETRAGAAAAEAAALADAGIALAIADLVNAQWARGWRRRYPPDGRSYACRLGGGRVIVAVTDEAGRIDLNGAGEELLRALLTGAGAGRDDARRLAAAIADWRDADSQRRSDGAEAEAYLGKGRRAPKNAPFEAPDELAQVIGMTGPTLARIAPFVTVHTGSEGFDPAVAPPGLVDMLAEGLGGGLAAGAPRSPFARPSPRRVFRIRAEARGERDGRRLGEAVVRVVPGRQRVYAVLAWGAGRDAAAGEVIDLGDC